MEREVIARRNSDPAIFDFVSAGIGACLLAYMVYLICTADDAVSVAMGILIAVICAAVFAWLLVEGILIMRSPGDIITRCGAELEIKGRKYIVSDVSVAELKIHRGRGGQFAFGNITINFKNGGKVVCRGVADPQNAYNRFCAVIYGSHPKASKGNKNG